MAPARSAGGAHGCAPVRSAGYRCGFIAASRVLAQVALVTYVGGVVRHFFMADSDALITRVQFRIVSRIDLGFGHPAKE
jgi:hypothetical protein